MTDKPSSLRDLYGQHDTSLWSFSRSSPLAHPQQANLPSWSTVSRPKVVDFLPGSNDTSPLSGSSTGYGRHPDIRSLFKDFMAFAMLQYTSVAVVMPFEVAKTLLQVQWIPQYRHVYEIGKDPGSVPDDAVALSDSEDMVSYFREPIQSMNSKQINSSTHSKHSHIDSDQNFPSIQVHAHQPEYVIPAGRPDGVWGMIKRVGEWKSEGYLSLWKGQLTATLLEVLSNAIQPIAISLIISFQNPPARLSSGVLLLVVSHAFTAYALLPLDLLRTKLITQPSRASTLTLPRSLSPVTPLLHLISQQGGLRAIYMNPRLYIPTLLDATVRPLLSLAGPAIIASCVGLQADGNPLLFGLVDLGWSAASLIVTLPIETAKRRLQVQAGHFDGCTNSPLTQPITCVETRPTPYRGVVDCIWRIITEECSDIAQQQASRTARRSRRWSLVNDTGVLQLYRGFSMNMWAHSIVFMLSALTGDGKYDRGWAEL